MGASGADRRQRNWVKAPGTPKHKRPLDPEILALVGELKSCGFKTKNIGRLLGLSPKTIERYLHGLRADMVRDSGGVRGAGADSDAWGVAPDGESQEDDGGGTFPGDRPEDQG